MAIRGENVGTAYVRILADGAGLGRSIRDEFDKSEPIMKSAGRDHSAAYTDGFTRGLRDRPLPGTLQEFLRRGVGIFDGEGRRMGSALSDGLREALEDAFPGGIGRVIFRDLRSDLNSGALSVDRLSDTFDNLRPRVARATREMQALEEETRAMVRETDRMTTEVFEGSRGLEGYRRSLENLNHALLDTDTKVEVAQFVFRRNREEIERNNHLLPRFNREWNTLSDTIGRFTGRGSRNDFLNFMGSMTRNIVRMVGLPARLGLQFFEMSRGLLSVFQQGRAAAGMMGGLRAVVARLGASMAGLGAALATAAVAIPVLVAALAIAVSVFSLLLGIVTSLASTITFALIAGVAALGATLLPVVAAIGVLVAGITSLDEKTKKALKQSIKPFTDEMKILGTIARDEIFGEMGRQAQEFSDIVGKSLRPVVRGIAQAISDVGDTFLQMMRGQGFRDFVATMERALPEAIRALGRITAQSLGGLGGIFTALAAPGGLLERFLGWLDRITAEFNEWANSADGRKELFDFFTNAGDSAAALGGFLRELTGLFADLFAGTNQTGNSIFDSMADAIGRLRDFLTENPDTIRDWAKDAEEFAQNIGNLVVAFAKFIDWLDDPRVRAFTNFLVNAAVLFARWIGVIANVIEWLGRVTGVTASIREGFLLLNAVTTNWGQIFRNVYNSFLRPILIAFGEGLGFIVRSIGTAVEGLGALTRSDSLKALGKAIQGVGEDLGNLSDTLHEIPSQKEIELRARTEKAVKSIGILLAEQEKVKDKIVELKADPKSGREEIVKYEARLKGINDKIVKLMADPTVGKAVVNEFNRIKLGPKTAKLLADRKEADRIIDAVNKKPLFNKGFDVIANAKQAINDLNYINGYKFAKKFIDIAVNLTGGLLNGRLPETATGGVFGSPQVRLIAEAGREAVVPLDRPLSQIDPAVRELAAFAQGRKSVGAANTSSGRSVTVGDITIVTPTEDPRAVAQETINRLAAAAYL